MTENIPQTSASARIEAARRALSLYTAAQKWRVEGSDDVLDAALAMSEALKALITPPSVGEDEAEIAERVLHAHSGTDIRNIVTAAVRAGIQYAHERWEPADVPSQEQMLRWLGIRTRETVNEDAILIREQYIEKEEI